MEKNTPEIIDLKNLSKPSRVAVLVKMFCNLEGDFKTRLDKLATQTNISRDAIKQISIDNGFEEIYKQLVGRDTFHAKSFEEILGLDKDVSTSTIAAQMKDFVHLGLKTSKAVLEYGSTMMMFYQNELTDLVLKSGGVRNLTAAQHEKIEFCEAQFDKYRTMLMPFIIPDRLMKYAVMIGLNQMEEQSSDIDKGALTTDALQQKLLELGMVNDKNYTSENIEDAILLTETEIAKMTRGGGVPDVDGRNIKTN